MCCVMETTWVCGELSLDGEGIHAWVCICLCARGQMSSYLLCAQVVAVSNHVFVCFRLLSVHGRRTGWEDLSVCLCGPL